MTLPLSHITPVPRAPTPPGSLTGCTLGSQCAWSGWSLPRLLSADPLPSPGLRTLAVPCTWNIPLLCWKPHSSRSVCLRAASLQLLWPPLHTWCSPGAVFTSSPWFVFSAGIEPQEAERSVSRLLE